jgi:hypothetical protein
MSSISFQKLVKWYSSFFEMVIELEYLASGVNKLDEKLKMIGQVANMYKRRQPVVSWIVY